MQRVSDFFIPISARRKIHLVICLVVVLAVGDMRMRIDLISFFL